MSSYALKGKVCFKILNCGSLENDHVSGAVGSGGATLRTADFKRGEAGNKPLVDPRSRDHFNERNPVVTPAAVHAEIHRGTHRNLRVLPGPTARWAFGARQVRTTLDEEP